MEDYDRWSAEAAIRDAQRKEIEWACKPRWYDRACVALPLIFGVWFGIPLLIGIILHLCGADKETIITYAALPWGILTIIIMGIGASGGR